jgi:hypothetical protein
MARIGWINADLFPGEAIGWVLFQEARTRAACHNQLLEAKKAVHFPVLVGSLHTMDAQLGSGKS